MALFNWIFIIFHISLALVSAGHALLFKRDPRAALGWIAVSLAFPVAGPLLYFLFGVNRVRTRARKLNIAPPFQVAVDGDRKRTKDGMAPLAALVPPRFIEIARMGDAVTQMPLVGGNRITPLHNGEAAYPRMLSAIRGARSYVYLTTYILETNATGRRFIQALADARDRGVEVRVIIDGIGDFYSLPRASTLLSEKGVGVVRFLPPTLVPPAVHINLRNHRKILIADGRTAFIGGMNIGDRHLADDQDNPGRVVDTHFLLAGPIVRQIEGVFIEDWRFSTGDALMPPPVEPVVVGDTICRAIVDGPSEELDKLEMMLVCEAAIARRRLWIMSPYFLPSSELSTVMKAAALRGVDVRVVLPGKNNLPYVHWAMRRLIGDFLKRRVRIFYQPPPFVHTKLVIVDRHFSQIGSANIDPRSLRLNFELSMEVYDREVNRILSDHFQSRMDESREILSGDIENRSFPVKILDAVSWLFSPYL
jgi:cardiolipin synthase A/B